jgi:hypothetical protein
MARKPFDYVPTEEDRRTLRQWTFGLAVFYGALLLTLVAIIGIRHHVIGGSEDVASTAGISARPPSTH